MATRKEEALRWVHLYALGGAAFAALPVSTTTGLSTLEAYMLKRIGNVYGKRLSARTISGAGGTFVVAGRGLRRIARGAGRRIPILRVPIRMGIAAGTIESIGRATVRYFERRYPQRTFHPTASG